MSTANAETKIPDNDDVRGDWTPSTSRTSDVETDKDIEDDAWDAELGKELVKTLTKNLTKRGSKYEENKKRFTDPNMIYLSAGSGSSDGAQVVVASPTSSGRNNREERRNKSVSFASFLNCACTKMNQGDVINASGNYEKNGAGATMPPSRAGPDDFDADKELRDPDHPQITYSLKAVIGEGGFSRVLLVKAKDGHRTTEAGVRYAAKIIPKAHLKMAGSSFVKATMLERTILGDIQHPFILKLYHAFQERDRLVFIVDFASGGSVHHHVNLCVREYGRGIDETRAGYYVAQVAVALSYLHKHGIVHRDLKLENILVKRSGHICICDFGTSKLLQPQQDSGSDDICTGATWGNTVSSSASKKKRQLPSHTKSIIGTPAYMAPEMLLEQSYNFSVDWWALGITLFTMLRAKLPFDGGRHNDEEKMLWRVVKSRPRYDPKWKPHTLKLLQSLLQKLPTTRICSLTELRMAKMYRDMDWIALVEERLEPPYKPDTKELRQNDLFYIPTKYAEAPLPSRREIPYKKGDSMRKVFRHFGHHDAFFETNDDTQKTSNGNPSDLLSRMSSSTSNTTTQI